MGEGQSLARDRLLPGWRSEGQRRNYHAAGRFYPQWGRSQRAEEVTLTLSLASFVLYVRPTRHGQHRVGGVVTCPLTAHHQTGASHCSGSSVSPNGLCHSYGRTQPHIPCEGKPLSFPHFDIAAYDTGRRTSGEATHRSAEYAHLPCYAIGKGYGNPQPHSVVVVDVMGAAYLLIPGAVQGRFLEGWLSSRDQGIPGGEEPRHSRHPRSGRCCAPCALVTFLLRRLCQFAVFDTPPQKLHTP